MNPKTYMGMVASVGCVACRRLGIQPAPQNLVHHLRTGQGLGQKSSAYLTVALCHEHHQGDFSIHNSRREFERVVGTELELLADTIRHVLDRVDP